MERELLTSSKIRSVLEQDGSHVDLCLPSREREREIKCERHGGCEYRVESFFQHTFAADIYCVCDKCKLLDLYD